MIAGISIRIAAYSKVFAELASRLHASKKNKSARDWRGLNYVLNSFMPSFGGDIL